MSFSRKIFKYVSREICPQFSTAKLSILSGNCKRFSLKINDIDDFALSSIPPWKITHVKVHFFRKNALNR